MKLSPFQGVLAQRGGKGSQASHLGAWGPLGTRKSSRAQKCGLALGSLWSLGSGSLWPA